MNFYVNNKEDYCQVGFQDDLIIDLFLEVILQLFFYFVIIYRIIGGVLDFYVFLGENFNYVFQQYIYVIKIKIFYIFVC